MSLTPGTRLGVYDITASIGEGGMGEVYRATDTVLGRQVAVKVLPDAFAADPDRMARFEREAKTLASLNHPHIAAIYAVEKSAGITALVMELVEGDDLSQRIVRGAIPIDEALPIARQIAEALEAAHEQGIIHRDLKPANIKARADGTVKVLDFGLAKAMEPPAGSSPSLSMSPTLTTPAMMTGVGMILGTAAYMAPEQAKGRAADKRCDIWAFGAVLFEMLTGRRAFEGEDVSDTLAGVLRGEPDWDALPVGVSPAIRTLIQRCLTKDRKQRIRDIGDVQLVLNGAFDSPALAAPATAPTTPIPSPRIIAVASVVLLAGGALAALVTWAVTRPSPPPTPQPVRFTVAPASPQPLSITSGARDLALSPDGTHLVYTTGTEAANLQLWVRPVDQLDAVPLRGLTGPSAPFISPDSRWIGFSSGTTLMKVSMTGGPPIALCQFLGGLRGASWGPDDTIVFATNRQRSGLWSVPAGGGEPTVLTTPDAKQGEVGHVFPSVLPGGQAVLFTILPAVGGIDEEQVAVLDRRTGRRTTLIRGASQAEYVDPGYLVYAAAGALRAMRFDPIRLQVLSDSVPVVDDVLTKASGAAEFSVSRTGTLVDVPGDVARAASVARTLVWVDRHGHEDPLKAPARAYMQPRLSPDGTRVALAIADQDQDIWIWDVAHETLTRLTFDPGADAQPAWTPDGRQIIFSSARGGPRENLYAQQADGTGTVERLTTSPDRHLSHTVSPDGTQMVFTEESDHDDLMRLTLGGSPSAPATGIPKVEPLLQSKFNKRGPEISPDGHWLAYASDESGAYEIYVRPFPSVNSGRWQLSTHGGTRPVWTRNGHELFYAADRALMSVPLQTTSTTFSAGTPVKLFDWPTIGQQSPARTYDVSRDGEKFLMIKEPSESPGSTGTTPAAAPIVVTLHWSEELKQRVPVK